MNLFQENSKRNLNSARYFIESFEEIPVGKYDDSQNLLWKAFTPCDFNEIISGETVDMEFFMILRKNGKQHGNAHKYRIIKIS